MKLRSIDAIWHVRGRVPLAPGQSPDAAFAALAPLFDERGTSHDRSGDTLVFRKQNPAAQDKMATFDEGILQIEASEAGPVLRYDLYSRMLLFCFVLPLFFIGVAQLTKVVANYQEAKAIAAEKAEKAAGKAKKPEKDKAEKPMNPIDKFLGAPAPEKPKHDAKSEAEAREKKKPKPTAAYVFAGIFASLYLIGRILEAWLVQRLFRRRLLGA